MRPLLRTLEDEDPGRLRIVAELWGLELAAGPARAMAAALAAPMLDPAAAREHVETLPADERRALDHLLAQGGRAALADLTRRFGPLREIGPGRRDRERPWRAPASPIEGLWYRGLIARAFADTPTGPQEFVFVPDDLARLLPAPAAPPPNFVPGQPAAPPPSVRLAGDAALDDAVTLLAALRRRGASGLPLPAARLQALAPYLIQPASAPMLLQLLRELGALRGSPLQPAPEAVREFLTQPAGAALARLQRAWLESTDWNDLAQVDSLEAPRGRWPNDPRLARRAVVGFLAALPPDAWWDLEALIGAVREHAPGFQRPGGAFDAWLLRDRRTGGFLRGFEHWQAVEGALLRALVRGPLHWLGVLDLGGPAPATPASCLRRSARAAALLDPAAPAPQEPAKAPASVGVDGQVRVPRGGHHMPRYQIARLSLWGGLDGEAYHYRLSPASLAAAAAQGLRAHHVRAILEEASGRTLPAPLARALERWEHAGAEARGERAMVLRVAEPRVLRELRAHPACARYLGEAVGPRAVLVAPRDWEKLLAAAARLGLLIEPDAGQAGSGP